MLEAIAARHPSREAIVFDGERITFAQLRDRARALAGGLAALGLGKGDALAIWLPNRSGSSPSTPRQALAWSSSR